MEKLTDITVIIRSVGERTTENCRHLLSRLVPEENLITICEQPFTAALTASYELGIERALPWTLCIDADVLVEVSAIGHLYRLAGRAEAQMFEIQGRSVDKLLGFARACGNHLYRTSLLERALEFIPDDRSSMRPESFVMRRMSAEGFPWMQEELIVGLHDFKQYYRDIYRKAFVHVHKHRQLLPYLEALWTRLSADDGDFRVALSGLNSGLRHMGLVSIDVGGFPSQAEQILDELGWTEKDPLEAMALSDRDVNQMLKQYGLPPEHARFRLNQEDGSMSALGGNRRLIWKIVLKRTGLPGLIRWLLAKAELLIRERRLPTGR